MDRPYIIAHRGASAVAPENTLTAFRKAIELGADGFELDVQLTKDGYVVVIHDETVNRTTDGRGRVSELTLRELRRLDAGSWFNRRHPRRASATYIGLKIPTLDEVLKLALSSQVNLCLELKYASGHRERLIEATLDAVDGSGLEERIVFVSFDHEAMKQVKRLLPDVQTGLLFYGWQWTAQKMITMAEASAADWLSLHYSLVSPRVVAASQRAGLAIGVWTINSKTVARGFKKTSIDAIITNYPDKLIAVFDEERRNS